MGVPDRFAIEYPMRCLELIEASENYAIKHSLPARLPSSPHPRW